MTYWISCSLAKLERGVTEEEGGGTTSSNILSTTSRSMQARLRGESLALGAGSSEACEQERGRAESDG